MVIVKNKLLYKGFKIKYKVHMDKKDLLGTDTYDLFIIYQTGFFGNVEHISLDKAWSAKNGEVEKFLNTWGNKSKEEIDTIAIESIKKDIDYNLKREERYNSFKLKFNKK